MTENVLFYSKDKNQNKMTVTRKINTHTELETMIDYFELPIKIVRYNETDNYL